MDNKKFQINKSIPLIFFAAILGCGTTTNPAGSVKVTSGRQHIHHHPEDIRLAASDHDKDLLQWIINTPDAKFVTIDQSAVSSAGLIHLIQLPYLNRLEIKFNQITSESIGYLNSIKTLKYLAIQGSTDDSLGSIKSLINIDTLSVGHGHVGPLGAKHISSMKNLRSLFVNDNHEFGDGALENIKDLTDLVELSLESTSITDEGAVHLSQLENLERLNIARTQVSNEGLKYLNGLTNLKELQLGHTKVTDDGLVYLGKLTNLQQLGLPRLNITDSGLVHLKPLLKLQVLYLTGTKVSPQAVQELRGTLPDIKQLTFGER